MITACYNEIDQHCCDWLSNLMDAGAITPGKIINRSILELTPDDVRAYDRVHFFAGIGVWDYALNLAGWTGRSVWTGSCPCQPFSTAGQGKAGDDARHLWPAWSALIAKCRPAVVIGEQVEAAIGWGWLDLVFSDLEAEGYACAETVLPAASVGAPHIRNRVWFVGHANSEREVSLGEIRQGPATERSRAGADGFLADATRERQPERERAGIRAHPHRRARGDIDGQQPPGVDGSPGLVADARHGDGAARASGREHEGGASIRERLAGDGAARGVADAERDGRPRHIHDDFSERRQDTRVHSWDGCDAGAVADAGRGSLQRRGGSGDVGSPARS